jgi:aspartate/methionine/tyrosine aminotransferase
LILNSPSSPTGAVYSADELAALAKVAGESESQKAFAFALQTDAALIEAFRQSIYSHQ